MARFEITAPDGARYEIEGENEQGALAALQKHLGPKSDGGVVADLDKAIPHGVVKGVAGWLGGPADAARGVAWLADQAKAYTTGRPYEEVRNEADAKAWLPSTTLDKMGSEGVQRAIRTHTPKGTEILDYAPDTLLGRLASTIGEFVPAIPLGPVAAVTSAVGSESAGQLAERFTDSPAIQTGARIVGAVASPSVAARVVTPVRTAPGRGPHVERLQQEGIELTAGQRTGSKPLQWLEGTAADLPGSGPNVAARTDAQGQQFNRAIARRMGEPLPEGLLTPEVMQRADARIGNQFDQLSARNTLLADNQLINDIRTTMGRHMRTLEAQQRQTVQTAYNDVAALFQPGPGGGAILSGVEYQNARSELRRLAESASSPREAQALRDIRVALDRAMDRSIAANNPSDVGAWRQARREYGNMKVVENTMRSSGERADQGFASPAAFRQAVAQRDPTTFVRGQGDLAQLAHDAGAVMRPLPQSGTTPRAWAQGVMTGGAGIGGTMLGGPIGGAAGMLASLAGPVVASRVLMSAPVQGYLANRLVPPAERDRVVSALLAAQRAQFGRTE